MIVVILVSFAPSHYAASVTGLFADKPFLPLCLSEESLQSYCWSICSETRQKTTYKVHKFSFSCVSLANETQEAAVGCCDTAASPGSDVGVWIAGRQQTHNCLYLALHCLQLPTGLSLSLSLSLSLPPYLPLPPFLYLSHSLSVSTLQITETVTSFTGSVFLHISRHPQ